MLSEEMHQKLGTDAPYEGLTFIDGGGLPWKITHSYYTGASYKLGRDMNDLDVALHLIRKDHPTWTLTRTTYQVEENISWGEAPDIDLIFGEQARIELAWEIHNG